MEAVLWANFVNRGWALKKLGTREVIVTDEVKANPESELGVWFEDVES